MHIFQAECCGVNAQYVNSGTNNDFSELDVTWWNNDRFVYIEVSVYMYVVMH